MRRRQPWQALALHEFGLQVFKIGVIDVALTLKGAIRQTPATLHA
jgi:hypothetical protein